MPATSSPSGPRAALAHLHDLPRIVAAPLLPIAAAALALEAIVRTDLATPLLWRLLDVPAHVADAAARHAEILACLYHGTRLGPAFTVEESRHILEVAAILATIRDVGFLAAALIVVIAIISRILRTPFFSHCLHDGARLGGAIATAIALLGLQWSFAFRAVHPLLFPGATTADDDGWDFPPDALLVRLYPDSYFAGVLVLVVLVWLALLLAAWLYARRRLGPAAPRPWGWTRGHAIAALIAACILPVITVAGYHLWRWQGPAADIADLVLLALLLGAIGAWFAVCRATAVIAFSIGLSAWLALGLGVHLACGEANRVAARGNAIISAIAAYRAAHGTLPATLDDLTPTQLTVLPAVTVGSGHWYYQHDGTFYWFGFQGPLAWMYEYVSTRGTWNLQQ